MTLSAQVRAALAWWNAELAAMVPTRILPRRRPTIAVDLHLLDGRIQIERVTGGSGERWVEEQALDALDAESWLQLRELIDGAEPRLWLHPPYVYSRVIDLPEAARRRLHSAVALQLEAISPVEPQLLQWKAATISPRGQPPRVRVTMAHSGQIDRISALFAENGLAAPCIYGVAAEGASVTFRAARGSAQDGTATLPWRVVGIIFLSFIAGALLTLAGATILGRANDRKAESLEPEAAVRAKAEAAAARDEQLRHALAPLLRKLPISASIDDLAERLPKQAHLVSLARDEKDALHIEIDARDPDMVRPALAKDPLLPNLRETAQASTKDSAMRISMTAGQ